MNKRFKDVVKQARLLFRSWRFKRLVGGWILWTHIDMLFVTASDACGGRNKLESTYVLNCVELFSKKYIKI